MSLSKLDKTSLQMQIIIETEKRYSYGHFLLALRQALGVSKQSVAYDLDLDYDDLCRHEDEKMSRRFDSAKNELLAEYYDIEPELLERKFREWQKSAPAKYNAGNKEDK